MGNEIRNATIQFEKALVNFSKNWTPEQVLDAIEEAYQNRKFVQGSNNTYEAMTKHGIKINMFIDSSGKIVSAFPLIK